MTAKKHKAISRTEAASSAITEFDKDMLQSLRSELTDAVVAVSQKHGLSLAFGKCTYTKNNATMKLEMSVKTADGVVVTREREDYQQFAHLYNLKPEWLDKTFESKGKTFRVAGLASRRSKRTVVCEEVGGGTMHLFSAVGIESVFDPEGLVRRKIKDARNEWDIYMTRTLNHRPPVLAGIEPEWLDKTFDLNGETYKVEGVSLSEGKYPIAATRVRDGAVVQFGVQGLKYWFDKEREAQLAREGA